MHSVSVPGAIRTAKQASDSRLAHFLARTGLTARGVIYVLVGWVTALVALEEGLSPAGTLAPEPTPTWTRKG